eukprot:14741157-Alexandrium_andersonii.AAC.1
MEVFIRVPGHVGPAHRRSRGLPQGCPLSTMMLAYFATGWANAMRLKQVIPRALADDLMVVSDDAAPEAAFAGGVEETLSVLEAV